ncbi:MAG TPA: hypothetical protein VEK76_04730 [Candidatus Binatia bacterium]|nr:hypothetical protein [Candidatus Binatia bacterium]
MLLQLTGRRTGRTFLQPVSHVRDRGTLLTPGGGNWKLNLVEGRPVPVHIRGQDRTARPEIVRDPEAIERLLRIMTRANPMVGRFVGLRHGPDGGLDRAALERAIVHWFVVVRWHLAGPSGRAAVRRETRRWLVEEGMARRFAGS